MMLNRVLCPEGKAGIFRWLATRSVAAALALLLSGCASSQPVAGSDRRPFDFQRDTFAYANELVWDYYYDEHGHWVNKPHKPKPDYTHHCFVVARSTRQFFEHARFDPTLPKTDTATYRRLVHQVLALNADRELPESRKVVIPGYSDLRAFSQDQERLLKAECGGAWQSYVQRGHWRMILPITRHHQEKMANRLAAEIKAERPPVVHLECFPRLTINHAVVLFDETETDRQIRFKAYDPNNPLQPVSLVYDRASRMFRFPANDYFCGGRVNVYEVYYGWFY
jgi:hypothetical protein